MSTATAPQSFAALRNRGYQAYFFNGALAMMADSIEHVISYWIIYEKFHSPALGGFAILAHWLPFLFFSVWSGALADRHDPRRLIQFGMLCFMGASLGWAYFFITDTLEMWHAMLLLVLHGFAGVFWHPSAQLLVHDIVGPAQLQSAIRLNATARYLGLLFGPAVGALILLTFGPAYGILLNALIYLPMIIWLWKAPYGPRFRKEQGPPAHAVRGVDDILATIRQIAGHPVLVPMILLAGLASLFVGNGYQPQMPEFAHDLGHPDADFSYSMLLAADAAGALSAGLLLESRSLLPARVKSACILAMLWCCAIAGFALVKNYPLALLLLFAVGFLELAFNAMAQTLVQLHAPAHLRGRVIGLYILSSLGMRAFSGVTIGIAGGFIGIHWSLALSAMVLFTLIGVLLSFATKRAATPA